MAALDFMNSIKDSLVYMEIWIVFIVVLSLICGIVIETPVLIILAIFIGYRVRDLSSPILEFINYQILPRLVTA